MSSQSLAGLSTKLGGRTPVRIYFLDNSNKMFLIDLTTTCRQLVIQILNKFEIKSIVDNIANYFGLFLSFNNQLSNESIGLDRYVYEIVAEHLLNSENEKKLVFMIRLFIPSIWGLQFIDEVVDRLRLPESETSKIADNTLLSKSLITYLSNAEVTDPALLHLQYIQAVYNVVTGAYPVDEDLAIQLASNTFLIKFFRFNEKSHIPGFLGNRIVEYIPIRLLKKGKRPIEEWELNIYQSSQQLSIQLSNQLPNKPASEVTSDEINQLDRNIYLQHRYMRSIYQSTFYGLTFYKITQKANRYLPENPIIGVYHLGVNIYDKQRQLIRNYPMSQILQWGYKPNLLFSFDIKLQDGELDKQVQVDNNEELSIEFQTTEGQIICDLLTDYALSFMKEKDLMDKRKSLRLADRKRIGGVQLPTVSKASNKTKAAILIQALFRGYILRKKWLEEDAAISIQCVYRGYAARKRVGKWIEELVKSGKLVIEK